MRDVNAAISHFVNAKDHGEAWRNVLDSASMRARARIGLAMYSSFYKDEMTREELDEFCKARDEIEDSLEIEDLRYLIRVMPGNSKERYKKLEAMRRGHGNVGQ